MSLLAPDRSVRALRLPAVLMLLLALSARGSQAQPAPGKEPSPDKTEAKELVVVHAPKKLTLDPARIYTTMESELSTALYEGLLTYHPFSLEPIPGVASDWDISRDKTRYRFTLREDALYSNGDPVRAQDFRDSWLRVLDPKTQAEYSFLFDVIKGAKAYRSGQKVEVGIRAVSDKVLEVELEKPASHFLKLLSHMAFSPVHPKYLSRQGWDQDPLIIGNGPYYLVKRGADELVLQKNRLYWDSRRVELASLRIRFMSDAAAVSEEFNRGNVQWATIWDTERLADRSKIVFHPLFATSYFYFVCSAAPWNDARVRRALALLVPWEQLRTQETLFPTARLIPAIPSYPEVKGIEARDETQALSLLQEAGYPGGSGLPEMVIKVPDGFEDQRIAGLMADAWGARLGLKASIRTYPYDEYLQEVKRPDYTLGTVTWIGDYADPLSFLQMWTQGSNLNDARFDDRNFDELIDASLSLEREERYKKLGQAEQILLSQAVVLPINHAPAFNLIDLERVEGWFPNVLNIHPFKYLRFRVPRVPPGVALGPQRVTVKSPSAAKPPREP